MMKKTLILSLMLVVSSVLFAVTIADANVGEVAVVENPQAVVDLVERIGGKGASNKFVFVLDPTKNPTQEEFTIVGAKGKVLISGNTLSAITTGLGWYLQNYAHINIAWNSLNEKTATGEVYTKLSRLPVPSVAETHVCDAKYRYYLNYCTFGYSMTSWTWKRWQQEIDWMALHGINMPLQIIGFEEVWRRFLTLEVDGVRKYNYTDEEAKAFVAGPAYIAWWGMNNLEGWGGTEHDGWGGVQDDAWYERQSQLAASILGRQRELGMQPVLPGFSGMVPSNFTAKTHVPTDANGGVWCGFTRPRIIDPTYSGFADIAKDYYDCLREVMGESQYYSMDPFHEGGNISSGKYDEAYYAVYEAMEAAKKGSQWVIQQWQWDRNQRKSIHAVPAGRLVVLDLFSDGKPAFDSYNGYAPQEAVFCAIPNFGGRSGLMGRLNNMADNYFTYKAKYPSIQGIGVAPEAIEQTPVTYDLLFQLPWMGGKPDMEQWIKEYATARYGVANAEAQQAWELLRQSVLNYGADAIQGPVEDVWAARPNLYVRPASTWGVTLNNAGAIYTRERRQMLADATSKLLGQHRKLGLDKGSVYESNYNYDLVELGGAVMADYAYDLLLGIQQAKDMAGEHFASDKSYVARRDAFLALIADMDVFKGTNLNFRLGKWTQEARDAASEVAGAVSATADWYEYNNARTLITTWGDKVQNGGLKDYSYRSWQGLLKDYYLPRWEYYFANGCIGCDYFFFEWNWAHGKEHAVGQTAKSDVPLMAGQDGYSYDRMPEGNTVKEAKRLFAKYLLPINTAEGVYYAYRHLPNNLSGKLVIKASAGSKLNLAPYLGNLPNVLIEGDVFSQPASHVKQVSVREDAPHGVYKATATLPDATVVTFEVEVE
ncbi:MAG: alpha-N-acetylglucosaminidase [Bacteroidaceae bacterium]|nr:alpha-N-acetylglucosaminidase [Bacteroidaceae bacterium]